MQESPTDTGCGTILRILPRTDHEVFHERRKRTFLTKLRLLMNRKRAYIAQ
jgi:hypothetical protein